MAKISIITVVLNDEKNIAQTIKSVINQTFSDYEYWIIDGKSSDNTLNIIKQFAQINPKIKWISEPDNGLYDAMNKGIDLATGQYLLFLNSGDQLFENTTLEKIFALPQADVYYGDALIVKPDGSILGKRRLRPPQKLNWKSLKKGMLVSHQAFIPKRSITPKFNLKYKFSADYDWMIRTLKNAKKIINTNIIIVKYLDEGLTKKHLLKSLKERFEIMANYYGAIPTIIRHFAFAFRLLKFYLKNRWY